MMILRGVFLVLAVVFCLCGLPAYAIGLLLAALLSGRRAPAATPCIVVTIKPAPVQGQRA